MPVALGSMHSGMALALPNAGAVGDVDRLLLLTAFSPLYSLVGWRSLNGCDGGTKMHNRVWQGLSARSTSGG